MSEERMAFWAVPMFATFRFGHQQDDFTYRKIDDKTGLGLDTDVNDEIVKVTVTPDKWVFVDKSSELPADLPVCAECRYFHACKCSEPHVIREQPFSLVGGRSRLDCWMAREDIKKCGPLGIYFKARTTDGH